MARRADSGIGAGYVGAPGILASAVLLAFGSLLLFLGIVEFWPTAGQEADRPVTLFGLTLSPEREYRLFLIAALAGALGGSIHGMRSLYWYVGNRRLNTSWMLMYAMLPLIGAWLGVLFYVVVRAGLLSAQTQSDAVSPFGIAAIAGLVGLFSQQAATKLKDVFETLFTTAEKGSDQAVDSLRVDSFSPAKGPVGVEVVVRGSGFSGAMAALFADSRSTPKIISDRELTAVVPAQAKTGKIGVQTAEARAESATDFEVTT